MSYKTTCPGCNSHTSSVYQAFAHDDPCPNCGLSAAAALEVNAARERKADEALTARYLDASKRADVAEAKVRKLESRLFRIQRVLEGDDDDFI